MNINLRDIFLPEQVVGKIIDFQGFPRIDVFPIFVHFVNPFELLNLALILCRLEVRQGTHLRIYEGVSQNQLL